MKVCVVGAGFVGLTTAIVFAEHDHTVTVVEVDDDRLRSLQRGEIPFHEPGVPEALKASIDEGLLVFTNDMSTAVADADASFICVGTPQGDDGAIDLRFIRQAAQDLGTALADGPSDHIVVVKSTVVPGTAAEVVAPTIQAACGRVIPVASNPEFLKEGTALNDARHPDRIVIGIDDGRGKALWDIYSDFDCPKLTVPTRTAEMIKYAANSFLAVKIAFANEMANLCEMIGVDWEDVVKGIGHDDRINPKFFQAGLGFGGSCFPKDVAALSFLARFNKCPSGILDAALTNNEAQPIRAINILEDELGNLQGKKIALLGLAFKAGTDDVRETRALPIFQSLREKGAQVVCHDPKAGATFTALVHDAAIVEDVYDAIQGADGIIIQTAWPQYQSLDPLTLSTLMVENGLIVDGRQTLNPAACREAGLNYRGIGHN